MEKVAPESVGLSAARLSYIDAALQPRIHRKETAGAIVAVARKGKLAHVKPFGAMDTESNTPMGEDALFRIASMTKSITASRS